MAQIVMDEVTKVYGSNVTAVDSLSLDIPDGEFMVFVGPSGARAAIRATQTPTSSSVTRTSATRRASRDR